MAALGNRALDHAEADDGKRRGRAGNDDVVVADRFGELGERNCIGMHRARERLAALDRAVRDRDRLRVLGGEVRRAELNHFARAHEEDPFLRKIPEKTKRKADGGSRKAHGVGADGGGGADFLGNREGGLEKMVEHRAQAVCVTGHLLGLLHLADDLRFAQNH